MKLKLPIYYKNFECIAGKCMHNCCKAGWEIDIDENSLNFYNSVDGDFGDKLKQNIVNNCDNTGKCFKLNSNCICPFLNKKNLCEIYINLGEDHLCEICTEHPRYYEWFDNYKEGGIGLCCEEAGRIILGETGNFSTYDVEIPYEECCDYDNELFEYLYSSREKIFSYINKTQNTTNSSNFNSMMCNILWYCNVIQQNIDYNLLDNEEIINIDSSSFTKTDITKIIEFMLHLEPNNKDWLNYLKNCINIYNQSIPLLNKFENDNPQVFTYLKNISIYFIWRYLLKGVFDEEIVSKITLMAVSVSVLKIMFFCKWIEKGGITIDDCIDIVRQYSEEIEYSEDNLNVLADACYDNDYFNIESIIGLF